jgi:hypothetical protein
LGSGFLGSEDDGTEWCWEWCGCHTEQNWDKHECKGNCHH